MLAARAYEALGEHKEALAHLKKFSKRIVDENARYDYLGRINK